MKILIILLGLCPALAGAGHNALLPRPQQIRYGPEELRLSSASISVASAPAAEDSFAASQLSAGLARLVGRDVPVQKAGGLIVLRRTGSQAPLPLKDEPAGPNSREAYRIEINPKGAQIRASSSARARAHKEDLRNARLLAEEAQERMWRALAQREDTYSVPSLLLAARMIDYAGQKYLYAIEIADIFDQLGPKSTRTDLSFWVGTQASARNHGRISDLMDGITELREEYRRAWNLEYTPYRLGSAIGRFDAEYEYWRRLQARLWEVRRTFKDGSTLPSLDSLRR